MGRSERRGKRRTQHQASAATLWKQRGGQRSVENSREASAYFLDLDFFLAIFACCGKRRGRWGEMQQQGERLLSREGQ